MPVSTKVILSNHNFKSCPDASFLKEQAKKMYDAGVTEQGASNNPAWAAPNQAWLYQRGSAERHSGVVW